VTTTTQNLAEPRVRLEPSPGPRPAAGRRWSRFRYPASIVRWGVLAGVVAFVAWSLEFLEVDLERLIGVFPRLGILLASRYYPPDLAYVLAPDFLRSVVQTLQMSLLGGLFGVLVAIPLAWFSAHNVTPGRRSAYPIGRSLVVGSRAIHETIWTVLFVMVLGFGMLSGVLALTMFCIGFAGKLFTDEIEAIDMRPVEALRAVGAGPLQVFQYGVVPQVRVAFVGIAIYTWDVAFRAAMVVGSFGGGGMGLYLSAWCSPSRPRRVAAILLTIIALVTVAELGSG
jgi:phosphonate transport system permease protein